VSLATFVYSFAVQHPDAMDMYTRMGQLNHFAFIDGGSWYFLLGAVVMVMMGLYSVHKANALYVKR